jgi:hypothetical protein
MREVRHGRRSALLVVATMLTVAIPDPSMAAEPLPEGLLRCPTVQRPGRPPGVPRTVDWSSDLDPGGTLRGHTLRFGERTWRAGPRGFADGPFRERLVTGERDQDGTTVRVVDLDGDCVSRSLRFEDLVYGTVAAPDGTLYVSKVAASDRRELGVWEVPADGGSPRLVIRPPEGELSRAVPRSLDLALVDGRVRATWCDEEACVAGEARTDRGALAVDMDPAAVATSDLPMRDPTPVPIYARWGSWQVLAFRFHSTDSSPSWMRDAVLAAAEDATTTSKSLSPIFYATDGAANGVIRYTDAFPSGCSTSIACASHDAASWTLRMRPQGYDFRWGSLRWCEKTGGSGCFDAEHVALHEFGHAIGLDHPEEAGFHLPPASTVMHQVTPAKPESSWNRHAFGSCDVASLQEQYGLPTMSTTIASCNDVQTTITLTASDTSLVAGDRVSFKATLRIKGSSAYGQLSGIRLNGREVQLRRRTAGTSGSWTISTMRPTDTPGVYSLSLAPGRSYELKAVFPTPELEGLRSSSSEVVVVRVTGGTTSTGCTTTCPNEEVDDPA